MSESQPLGRVLPAALVEILEEGFDLHDGQGTDQAPALVAQYSPGAVSKAGHKAARAVGVRNRSMRNDRESVVQLFFGHNRRLPFLYVVTIGLG